VTETVRFLALLEVLGLAGLPLAALVLGRLPGGGLGFAKPLALLLAAWLAWIAGSAGVPNGLGLAAGAVAAVAVLGLVAWRAGGPRAEPEADPLRRPLLLWAEGIFLVFFLGGALLNAFSPDVWGTEKPMDMALLNATIQSDSFPPHDPWLAGEDLNYYYVGHLAAGLLVRLTDVEPSAGYNLALAAIFALSATAAFSLTAAAAPRRRVGAGLAAVALMLLLGNVRGGLDALGHDGPLVRFDWFAPSRVIPDTITEFPAFSFLLGDLHAHVLAIPFTLLAVAFALQVALAGPLVARSGRAVAEVAAVAVCIGTLYAINSWSWPVAAVVLVLAMALWLRDPAVAAARGHRAVWWTVLVLALGAAAVLPFLLSFDPNARGLDFVPDRQGLGEFLVDQASIYGLLAWLTVTGFAARLGVARHPFRWLVWGGAVAAFGLPLLAMAGNWAGVALLALLVAVALGALWSRHLPAPERFWWLLVAGGLGLLLLPEVVYVRDEFDDSGLFRMNTIFKLGYQAWLLLAVAGGVGLVLARDRLAPLPRRVWWLGAAVLAVICAAYSVAGTYSRKAGFAESPRLEGRDWLAREAPGDVAAIDWLRANADGDDVVLEAVGEDYSEFGHARISTYTGLATVLGWPGHEVQWSHDPGRRREEVRAVYTARGRAGTISARAVLDRYRVRWVVVGPLERTDYGDAGAATLERFARRAFEQDGTVVFEITR